MNELDLFAAAIGITDPEERAALLERECAGRPEVRNRLDQLLDAHFKSNPLLDAPAQEQTNAVRDCARSRTAPYRIAAEAEGRSSPAVTSCSSRSAKAAWARSGWPTRPSR